MNILQNLPTTKNYFVTVNPYKEPKNMSRIAEMYANGHYVEKDYGKAEEWYKKAADHGKRSRFDYDLAEFFYKHLQNYDKAFEYYTEAIEKEDDVDYTRWSECKLGIMYKNGEGVRKNHKKAFKCFTKAVQYEDGDYADSEAQRLLGNMYHYGHGVKKDLKKAKEWYEKAAKNYYGDDEDDERDYDEEAVEMLERDEFQNL